MTGLVSVIIPNYNYGRFLETTIKSVLSQTASSVDLIIVDNGSTDDSREVLDKYRGELNAIFQNNQGQASARNTGLAHAKGSLIAFLDADDYWEPTKLERQKELIREDAQLIYTGIRRFNSDSGSTISLIKPFFEGNCQLAFIKYPSRAIVPGGESSALLSRDFVDRVGLFNVELNSATGRDFFRRCSRFTNFRFVDEPLLNLRVHSENMSANSKKMMDDTAKAYDFLFNDDDWTFARDQRRRCLSKLQWSYMKTNLKKQN